MTHEWELKVKKFKLSSAERFGTVEENLRVGGGGGVAFRVKD